jgi:hypothetical protein
MAVSIGQSSIITNGLVLHLDAANPYNYKPLNNVEVLVVAGGGAGGGYHGGGGGGGGVIYSPSHSITPGSTINVTVGPGGTAPTSSPNTGNPGGNSVFDTLTAIGGGAGISQSNEAQARNNGGSGGGGCDGSGSVNHPGGSGTPGQGFKGGDVFGSGPQLAVFYGTAGGGGAGGPGGDGGVINGGFGGPGLPFSISGNLAYYGGGGGGTHLGSAGITYYGLGGIGGGGTGGISPSPHNVAVRNSLNGVNGTGGGGAGHLYAGLGGGAGGSGVVIVRYPGPQKATGGTITNVGGHTIHTFTSSGTFTPLTAPVNGGTAYGLQDLSGNNSTGVQFGGVTYSPSNGGSLILDGENDYIDCGKTASQFGIFDADYTFDAWVYPTNLTGDRTIFGTDQTTLRMGLHLIFRNGAIYQGHFSSDTSAGTATLNGWNNITYTYVRSSGLASIYKNGVLQGSGTIGSFIGTTNILISRWGTERYFSGSAGNYKIYNRALTATEIQQNFNAQRGRFGI